MGSLSLKLGLVLSLAALGLWWVLVAARWQRWRMRSRAEGICLLCMAAPRSPGDHLCRTCRDEERCAP